MPTVLAGSRLLLSTGGRQRVLRALSDVELTGGWALAVVADAGLAGLADDGTVELEVPTDAGPVRVQARLDASGGGLVVRAAGPVGAPEQRRENVRATLDLGLRGALVTPHRIVGRPTPLDGSHDREADLEGETVNASAGGIAATLAFAPARLQPGTPLQVELDLPGGGVAAATACVVDLRGRVLRARFDDITQRDRERLVKLVFARQRADLAARRALRDALPLLDALPQQ